MQRFVVLFARGVSGSNTSSMHIILGGNGHIGSVLAETLLSQGEPVTIVSRDSSSESKWRKLGAQVAVADVHDASRLEKVFAQGKRLFLLNPPAAPASDTDVEERKSVASILAAVKNSGLEKVVAQSTYGAQPGQHIADLGVLYELEQGLSKLSVASSIIRAAYYMSNWDFSLQSAQQEGIVYTFLKPDFALPMVAPQDIGRFAARLMAEPTENTGLHNFEGPQRYSPLQVAEAFSSALRKPVQVVEIPQQQWKETMQAAGYSAKAAVSFANMTETTAQGDFPARQNVVRGTVTLSSYVSELVRSA